MRIELSDEDVRRIVLTVANRRTAYRKAKAVKDYQRMELHEQFLSAAALILDCFGPRQRQIIEERIRDASPSRI